MKSPFREANAMEWLGDIVRCQTSPTHASTGGSVHGGVMATMLDSAMGGSVIQASSGRRAVTSQMSVSFLEPAQVGDLLEARATVDRVGSTLAYATGELRRVADGLLIATATGVFAILPAAQ